MYAHTFVILFLLTDDITSLSRPFERTITLQKDSAGHVGFVFKDNEITAIVKDSSAARNGVLIDHHLLEVDGQNVVGLKVRTELQSKHQVKLFFAKRSVVLFIGKTD